jgi:hypothetical protein
LVIITESDGFTIHGALKLASVRIEVVGENCQPLKPKSINCPVCFKRSNQAYFANNGLAKDVMGVIYIRYGFKRLRSFSDKYHCNAVFN